MASLRIRSRAAEQIPTDVSRVCATFRGDPLATKAKPRWSRGAKHHDEDVLVAPTKPTRPRNVSIVNHCANHLDARLREFLLQKHPKVKIFLLINRND